MQCTAIVIIAFHVYRITLYIRYELIDPQIINTQKITCYTVSISGKIAMYAWKQYFVLYAIQLIVYL